MNVTKKILLALIAVSILVPAITSARTFVPAPKESIPTMKFGLNSNSLEMGSDPPAFMFILTGGILAGGKQHTCYMVKSKMYIKKFAIDGTMYQHFYGDRLFNANISVGNVVAFSVGAEFGDRTYFMNKDSTLEHIRFKNTATGEVEPYDRFADFTTPQDIVSYNLGISFGGRFKQTNYWRGVGECWSWFNCKWELMYAPTIGFDKTMDITTQGPYQAQTNTYELDGVKVRKFGFRLMLDMRMGGKIGWLMETGMRPGIRYEINEEGRFSNGYLRMGVTVAISVGGRKDLYKPGFGREVPDN